MAESALVSSSLSCTASALDKSIWKDSGSRLWAVKAVCAPICGCTAGWWAPAGERSEPALVPLAAVSHRSNLPSIAMRQNVQRSLEERSSQCVSRGGWPRKGRGAAALMPPRHHRSNSSTRATVFYRWQKEFFENGAAAFQATERPRRQVEEKQKRIEFLEKKVQTKDEVLAELMAEHVALKKTLGEL